MIVDEVLCPGTRHGSEVRRCRCPSDPATDPARPKRRQSGWTPRRPGVVGIGPATRHIQSALYPRGPIRRNLAPDSVDEVAVDRAVGGDRLVPLSTLELDRAIDILDGRGLSCRMVANILGVSGRTVTRRRSARRRDMVSQVTDDPGHPGMSTVDGTITV